MKIVLSRIILLITTVAALVLYFNTPENYSYEICYGCFLLFCVDAFLVYRHSCKHTLVNFEFFFSIAFAFVNYVYPIVFYQVDPYFSLFGLSFPENYINRGAVMATIAYSCLSLGLLKRPNCDCNVFSSNYGIGHNKNFILYSSVLLLIMDFALAGAVAAGADASQWGLGGEIRGIVDVFVYYTIFRQLYINRGNSIIRVVKSNKLFWLLVAGYVILATLTGNRGILIRVGSLILLLYTILYHQIRKVFLAIIMIAGIGVMFVIGAIRDSGSVTSAVDSSTSVLSIGRDLTINNRSLYVLMDYADKHGNSYGQNFLSHLLSPIPFAQSTLLKITGWKVRDISSGNLVTDDYFENNATSVDAYGLGTNLVGDVYLAFGLWGVIFLFYILGTIISRYRYHAQLGSPISLLVYSLLFITAIIWTREAYFKPLQLVLWCLALYYFIDKKQKVQKG